MQIPEITETHLTKAYVGGVRAARDGRPATDCPFSPLEKFDSPLNRSVRALRENWLSGYTDKKAIIEESNGNTKKAGRS